MPFSSQVQQIKLPWERQQWPGDKNKERHINNQKKSLGKQSLLINMK